MNEERFNKYSIEQISGRYYIIINEGRDNQSRIIIDSLDKVFLMLANDYYRDHGHTYTKIKLD